MFVQKKSRLKNRKGPFNGPFRRAFGGSQLEKRVSELLGLGFGVGFRFPGVFDVDAGRSHLVLNRDL